MIISDVIIGKFNDAKAYWHLHPLNEIKKITENEFLIILPNKKCSFRTKNANIKIKNTSWHRVLEESEEQKFELEFKSGDESLIRWE